MHAIRRQAYRVASAQAEDGAINYNPFARTRSRPIRNTTVDEVEHEAPSYTPPTRTRTGFARSSVIDVDNASLHIVSNSQDESGRLSPAMEQQDDTIQRISSHVDPPSFPTARMESKGFSITDEDVVARPGTTLDISKEERRKQMLSRSVPVGYQIRALLFYNYVATILLPFIPAGFAVKYAHTNTIAVFCINFAAIVPSATALSMVLKDLYIRSGDKVSALLNQTLGNAVQLILSVLLLKSRQINVLKYSLIGAILSNLLLTTGLSFFFGGCKYQEQFFNLALAQMISMFLLLAVSSLTIPSASHLLTNTNAEGILAQSRGISVVVLVSYGMWLLFTLVTHRKSFDESPNETPRRIESLNEEATNKGVAVVGAILAGSRGGEIARAPLYMYKEEECSLSLVGACITLVISVVLLAFNTQFATDSIQGILLDRKVSQTFLSLIILPLLSNDPMAINMAMQNNLAMSISLTLERCIQTCLLVVPLTILLAWCMGIDDMDLEFDGFSIMTLFVSIIIVTYVIQEGKSTWLTGALLIKVFIIIALAAFYIP